MTNIRELVLSLQNFSPLHIFLMQLILQLPLFSFYLINSKRLNSQAIGIGVKTIVLESNEDNRSFDPSVGIYKLSVSPWFPLRASRPPPSAPRKNFLLRHDAVRTLNNVTGSRHCSPIWNRYPGFKRFELEPSVLSDLSLCYINRYSQIRLNHLRSALDESSAFLPSKSWSVEIFRSYVVSSYTQVILAIRTMTCPLRFLRCALSCDTTIYHSPLQPRVSTLLVHILQHQWKVFICIHCDEYYRCK